MASLISRLSTDGDPRRMFRDQMYIIDGRLVEQDLGEVISSATFLSEPADNYDAYQLATVRTTVMDVVDAYDSLYDLNGVPCSLIVMADDNRQVGIEYHWDPANYGRLNRELGLEAATDSCTIQWDGLIGSIEEFGPNRLKISSNTTITIEQDGDSGGLDPDDPSDPEDPPVDPGEDPDVIVVGGVSEIDATVNPNSRYVLKFAVPDGVTVGGIKGMDTSMSWNAKTLTLTGWMLGPGPKTVTLSVGDSEVKIIIRAYPVSQHVI